MYNETFPWYSTSNAVGSTRNCSTVTGKMRGVELALAGSTCTCSTETRTNANAAAHVYE